MSNNAPNVLAGKQEELGVTELAGGTPPTPPSPQQTPQKPPPGTLGGSPYSGGTIELAGGDQPETFTPIVPPAIPIAGSRIGNNFSGIVYNQNATPNGSLNILNSAIPPSWLYQQFTLPTNLARGSQITSPKQYPDITGVQIFTTISKGMQNTAALNYVFEIQEENGWTILSSGTAQGAVATGLQVWFDIIFPISIPIGDNPTATYRFGLQLPQGNVTNGPYSGITNLWYISPPPSSVQSVALNGNPILIENMPICLNYRLLGLVADSGISFLGNNYRSLVRYTNPAIA